MGEAFDKTAKLIGLSYPGGAEIEREAVKGNENRFILDMAFLDLNKNELIAKDINLNFKPPNIETL